MPDPFSASPDPPDGMFARTIDLLGRQAFDALQRARVVVVGLGGVGSHAASALARGGVGHLRLVDFDRLTRSSLNRHLIARQQDVGQSKAGVLATHLGQVCPGAQIEVCEAFFHLDTAEAILGGPVDFVVDAIDSFNPKVALLRHCVQHEIDVVACMGASARTNSTLVRVGDLSQTRVCPLARAVRRRLAHEGIRTGIVAVYSVEEPLPPLPPDDEDLVLQRGRPRNRLPSLSYMPGIFGYVAASEVLLRISGRPAGRAR